MPALSTGPRTRRVILLGATGSVGSQTVEVIAHLNGLAERGEWHTRYRVVGMAAGGRSGRALAELAGRLGVRDLALAEEGAVCPLEGARVRRGPGAAEALVREVEAEVVLAAVVGSAGLPATLAAVELGRDVALANKEALVAAGSLIVPAARASGARLLPVDSEHSALWQCLAGAWGGGAPEAPPFSTPASVRRLILTASGGPFREWAADRLAGATPEQALRHPVWSMGPKVTIDCASLMNKALEVVEAHWLFGVAPSRIEVVIHPRSVVHSLVEFADGSAIAQLGSPDMRSPIQYALTFPERPPGAARPIDWRALGSLEFHAPDRERFGALDLAYRVIERGGTAGAVFNAANEAAVEAFIAGRIAFGRITELASAALEAIPAAPVRALGDVVAADARAREFVRGEVGDA